MEAADRAAFFALAQREFGTVFAEGADSVATLAAFDAALKADLMLARYARA